MKERYIPKDYKSREYKDANAIIYYTEKNGAFYAIAYSGKRSKPDFNYKFKSEQSLETHISCYLKTLIERERSKIERKEKRLSFEHSLKIGDILYCSWGYDQTNIDFYQVIGLIGKHVKIKEINSSMPKGEEGFMTGHVIPIKDSFTNDNIYLKKVLIGNTLKINSFSWANPWDGTPKRTSWYA